MSSRKLNMVLHMMVELQPAYKAVLPAATSILLKALLGHIAILSFMYCNYLIGDADNVISLRHY